MSKVIKKQPPSPAMIAMLENLASGLPATAGLRGRSAHGGAAWTLVALRNRGLLGQDGVTAEGYAAIAKARAPKPGRNKQERNS